MGRRNHGDGLAGDVDMVLQAVFVDVGESSAQTSRVFMGDIQVDAAATGLKHFVLDRARVSARGLAEIECSNTVSREGCVEAAVNE